MVVENPQGFEDSKKYEVTIWSKKEMVAVIQKRRGELPWQMIKRNKDQQRTKLDIEMEVILRQLMKIPKRKSKQIEVEVKDNMHPMKRTNEYKEIE